MRKAIICDLDGTLALMGDRKPYGKDIDVSTDTVNEPVRKVLQAFDVSGAVQLVFVSGRESLHREATANWLDLHMHTSYELFMRETGDYRKDTIIKREIFEREIRDKYEILFVFDDRNQVVDMWRKELNLPCFQVDYGDF